MKPKNIKNKNTKEKIYLDYASSTPLDPRVLKVLTKVSANVYANPSALHVLGVEAHAYLDRARKKVADTLGAHENEIIFCSGGTESDNIAILGTVRAFKKKFPKIKPHIIISSIEHAAVLAGSDALSEEKVDVSVLPVNEDGIVDPHVLRKLLRPETVLVSVMYANNEIGTIQSIREIAKELRHYKKSKSLNQKNKKASVYPLFHTDASQALNYLPVSVEKLGVDLLTINSSKIYGPKGVGALYIKRNTPIAPILFGGDQEYGLRPGTESLPSIVAFAEAVAIADALRDQEVLRLTAIRDVFIKKMKKTFPNIIVNGSLEFRLPNNINVSIPNYSSEMLVLYLDAEGIYVSAKSACKSIDPESSHVIQAIRKKSKETEEGSIRFSMGRGTTAENMNYTLLSLKRILELLKKK